MIIDVKEDSKERKGKSEMKKGKMKTKKRREKVCVIIS
jgi:hypothetical protein